MVLTQSPPITLHLGAHRTASSSLQRLLEGNTGHFAQEGVAIWTPRATRSGLMTGLAGDPGRQDNRREAMGNRAAGRIALRRTAMARDGVARLVISDENMLGGLRENVLLGRLYPTAGGRLARLTRAMPGVDHVCLAVRSPDAWWTSAFAFLMTRGFGPADRATLNAVLKARRGWRRVVEDLAAAAPRARLTVWCHEDLAHASDLAAEVLTGVAPRDRQAPILNRSLSLSALNARLRDEGYTSSIAGVGDSYAPFAPDERAALRAAYAKDLAWLRDGADGLATFVTRRPEEPAARDRKGTHHVRRRQPQGALDATGRGGTARPPA